MSKHKFIVSALFCLLSAHNSRLNAFIFAVGDSIEIHCDHSESKRALDDKNKKEPLTMNECLRKWNDFEENMQYNHPNVHIFIPASYNKSDFFHLFRNLAQRHELNSLSMTLAEFTFSDYELFTHLASGLQELTRLKKLKLSIPTTRSLFSRNLRIFLDSREGGRSFKTTHLTAQWLTLFAGLRKLSHLEELTCILRGHEFNNQDLLNFVNSLDSLKKLSALDINIDDTLIDDVHFARITSQLMRFSHLNSFGFSYRKTLVKEGAKKLAHTLDLMTNSDSHDLERWTLNPPSKGFQ